jgi:FkbM family methyltransferase
MKVLIDCGSNLGQGYEDLKQKLKITSEWKVFMFEPNPNCFEKLISTYQDKNFTIFNKAVHSSNKNVKLFIPKNDDYSVSSTIYNDFHNSKYNQVWDNYIEVESSDLIELINSIDSEDDIFLKLDIEGSEYDLLEKLINENLLIMIKKLYVEFHNQYVSQNMLEKHNLDFRKQNILDYLYNNKIDYELWY